MSANNPGSMADVLLDYASKKASIDAARFGGATHSGKFGGLLDILLPAYQAAFPKAPAANLMLGARHAWNAREYNQEVAKLQAAEQARITGNRNIVGKTYQQLAGGKADLSGGVDKNGQPIYTLDLADYKQLAPDIGNAQGVDGIMRMANGQNPMFGGLTPMGTAWSAIHEGIMKPGQEATQWNDFYNRMNQKNPYAAGLAGMLPAPNLDKFNAQGKTGLEYEPGKPFETGTSKSGLPPRDITPMERFESGAYYADPKDVISGLAQQETVQNNDKTQKLAKARFDHDVKKFGLEYALKKRELEERIKGGMFRNDPPAGPGFNLNAAMWNSMTPEQRDEWKRNTAKGTRGIDKDPQEESLYRNVTVMKTAHGENSEEAKAAAKEYADYIRLNSPGNRAAVQSLNFGMPGLMDNPTSRFIGTPFGNKSSSPQSRGVQRIGQSKAIPGLSFTPKKR